MHNTFELLHPQIGKYPLFCATLYVIGILYILCMYFVQPVTCERGGEAGGRPGGGDLGDVKFILPMSFLGLSQEKGGGGRQILTLPREKFSLPTPLCAALYVIRIHTAQFSKV